jgi:hypothetical protein
MSDRLDRVEAILLTLAERQLAHESRFERNEAAFNARLQEFQAAFRKELQESHAALRAEIQESQVAFRAELQQSQVAFNERFERNEAAFYARFAHIEAIVAENSRSIAELRVTTEQQLDAWLTTSDAFLQRIDEMQAEVRGLQTENRRILEILERRGLN